MRRKHPVYWVVVNEHSQYWSKEGRWSSLINDSLWFDRTIAEEILSEENGVAIKRVKLIID